MSRTSKLYAAKGLTSPTTHTPIMAQKKEKVLPSFSRTAKLYAQKGLTRPTTTTPIMQSTSLNTTRLKPVESIATTNSQVSIGPVNRFNSGPTAMEHDQSSNYKAPAKYTYESVQDRINNYQADFDTVVKHYGATQDENGAWRFMSKEGLDAANRLQQEMEAALTDYNGYYSSKDYVKPRMASLEIELEEAREEVQKAQDALSAYEGMYMGSLDFPDIKAEYERLQGNVKTALDRKNALEAERMSIANSYYKQENETQFQKLSTDSGANDLYTSAKTAQSDMEKVAYMINAYTNGENSAKTREYKAYLMEQYGLTEEAFTLAPDMSMVGQRSLQQLYSDLSAQVKQAQSELEGQGYNYERMTGYEGMIEKAEEYKVETKRIEAAAKEMPVAGSIVSVIAAPMQGADYARLALGNIGHNDIADLENYVPLNVYDMDATNLVTTIRNTVSKEIEKKTNWEIAGQNVASFLYQTGMSIADSASQIALFGTFGTYVMGASAAAQTSKEAIERGATNGQALTMGLAAGAAEAIFEKFSVDNLLAKKNVTGVLSALKETAKQAGVEASEEAFTEIANILTDVVIMKDKSNFNQMVSGYQEQGMSAENAKKKAFLDLLSQVGWSAVGGALSGGFMGGGTTLYQGANYSIQAQSLGQQLQTAGGLEQVELALAFAEDTKTVKQLETMQAQLKDGKAVDAGELGAIAMENAAKVQKLVAEAQQFNTPEVSRALSNLYKQVENSGYVSKAQYDDLRNAVAQARAGATTLEAKAAVTQKVNPEASVQDAATTLFLQAGFNLKTAQIRSDVVRRLVEGDETVTERDINKLEPTHPITKKLFTEVTGVQFPDTKLSTKQLYEIYRSAHTVAQQKQEAQAQQAQAAEALQVIQAQTVADIPAGGNDQAAFAHFMSEAQQQFPNVSQEQLSAAYNQHLNGTKTVSFAGRSLNRDQFVQMMKSSPNGQALSQNEIDAMFNRAILDTLRGKDAFARYALNQKQQTVTPEGNAALRATQDALAQRWTNILKKFGIREVRFADDMKANENASYKDGVVTFNRNRITDESILAWTLGHELVHSIRDAGQRKVFVDDVIKTFEALGELKETQKEVDQLRKLYEKHSGKKHDDTYIREELAADLMREAFLDHDMMVKLGAAKPSLLYKAKQILNRLLKQTDDKAAREAIENLQNRLLDAIRVTETSATYESGHTVTNEKGEPVAQSDEDGSMKFSLRTYDESGREVLSDWMNVAVENNDLTREDADEILRAMDDIYRVCQDVREDYAPFDNWSEAKVVTDSEGHPVFSVVKKNGEYAMNLDFSTVCKKRRTLDAVLNELIARGDIEKIQFDKEGTNFVRINDIIREHGFETACALCFVDAKRFKQANVADTFVNMWNKTVKSIAPKDAMIASFNFGNNGLVDDSVVGIEEMNDLDLSALDKAMQKNGERTVPYAIAKHLKENPQDRKLLMRGDFLSSEGFTTVSVEKPEIYNLFVRKKGTAGPKSTFPDVQYLNEIIRSKRFDAEKAYAVGGVRVQSFSDYVPRMVFDYVQMFADMAAKKLPAHAYTKEELFVKQFGLTGIKINMSLVPAVVEDGVAPGLDAEGNYVWADESFDYNEAKRIQRAEGYSRNCGTICVGISDEHIRQLLADDTIRMVIPYHKSGLNRIIATMNNVERFTDYTKKQNTRHKDGTKLSKDEMSEVPDFNQRLHELGAEGDPRAVAEEYVRWCEENDYLPKFDQFAYQQIDGVFVEENGKKTVDPNYYKLLVDFSVYDNGTYTPQEGVTMTFPTEDSAFGSMAELIKRGLEEDAILEGKRSAEVGKIADEIEREMVPGKRYSIAYEHADNPVMAGLLNVAKDMYADNKSAEEIFDKTSWRRSKTDGRWRFEIDDSKMHWKKDPRTLWGQTVKLGDVVKHTLLFRNYPSLATVNVTFDLPSTGTTNGEFDHETNTIRLKKNHTNTLKNRQTLIHEIQHAIQSYEFEVNYNNGVALEDNVQTGFNPNAGYEVVFAKAYVRVKGDPEFQALSTYEERVRYVEHEIAETERRRNPKGNRSDAYYINRARRDVYENALGEVEAEDTANRLEYDDNWRDAHAPESLNSNKAIGSKMLERSRDLYEIAHKEMGWNGVDDKAGVIYNASRKGGVSNAEESADYGEDRTGSVGRTSGGTETLSSSGSGRQPRRVSQSSLGSRNEGALVQEDIQNKMSPKASDDSGAFSLPETRYSISRAQDKAYAEAVESGDILTAQRMVDEAAKAAGYVQAVFHGTDGEFNRFDRNIAKRKAAEHRWLASYPAGTIFLAGKRSTASGYGNRRMDLYLDTTGMKTFKHKDMYAADAMDELHTGDIGKYPVIAVEGSDDIIYATLIGSRVKRTDAAIYDDNGDLIPLSKRFNKSNSDMRYSLNDGEYADTFYSHMGKVIDEMKMPRLGAANGINYLKGRGVKDEEIKWSGIEEFFADKKSVSKEELQEFVRNNQLVIEEDVLGDKDNIELTEKEQQRVDRYRQIREEVIVEIDKLLEDGPLDLYAEWQASKELAESPMGLGYIARSDFRLLGEAAENYYQKELRDRKEPSPTSAEWRAFVNRNDDFGFDNSVDPIRYILSDPVSVARNYDMSDEDKQYLLDFAELKKRNDKVAQEWSRDPEAVKLREIESWVDDAMDAFDAEEHILEKAKKNMHRTRWKQYSTNGGYNYREILFRMPDSSYTNEAMEAHWKEGAQGILAHARIQDFDTADGKMLFIEEIQSDWHNAGHKEGYIYGVSSANLDALRDEVDQAKSDLTDAYVAMSDIEGEYHALLYDFDRISNDNEAWQKDVQSVIEKVKRATEAHKKARSVYVAATEKLQAAVSNGSVPDAPFRNNYHEFVLKRLLREAAEQGYDSIGWTTGKMQEERWSSEYAEGYRIEYDQDIPKFLNKYGKKWGAKVDQTYLDTNGYNPEDVREREMELLMALEAAREQAENTDLMNTDIDAFLANQRTITNIEETLELLKGTKVWTLPITDAMRESVLYEGQPRFSLTGEKAILSAEDKANLQTAKKMKEDGKSDEEIFRETGWYMQSDGKWRTEILDEIMIPQNFSRTGLQSAKNAEADKYMKKAENALKDGSISEDTYEMLVEFAEEVRNKDYDSGKLPVFLDAPRLYEAYPQLKNVTLFFKKLSGMQGYTDVGLNQIVLDPDGLHDAGQTVREGLAHEIQHIIQSIEGFARGSTPGDAGSYEAYRNAGGEIEARDVENRLRMTSEERRNNMPVRFSLSDSEYMTAVENGDMETAQRMVDEAAKAAGYPAKLYHGTPQFGFTKADVSKSDDKISFFATDSLEVAETYSGKSKVKQVSDAAHDDIDSIEEAFRDKQIDLCESINRVAGYQSYIEYNAFDEYWEKAAFGSESMDFLRDDFYESIETIIQELFPYSEYYKRMNDEGIDQDELYEQFEESDEVQRIYSAANDLEFIFRAARADNSGNYQLYANIDNLFELDAKGKSWATIPFDEYDANGFHPYVNTRQAAAYAKSNGFAGVKISNVFDDGGRSTKHQRTPATVYIFFKPQEQIKSADPVTYDDNGNVIPLSERFNSENNDIRYSLKDSDGNELSEGQAEYFKDSKVRDSKGRLKVVYHGTDSEFYEFDRGLLGSSTGVPLFGDGFYFTNKKRSADTYGGRRIDAYLNLTNPYYATESDAGMLRSEALIKQGYDGIILKANPSETYYIAFQSNQIKEIDNLNPTEDPDIRYSITPEFEEWYLSQFPADQQEHARANLEAVRLAGQMAQGRKMAPQIRKAEEKLEAEKEKARAAAKQAREDKMKALADQDLAWNIHHTAEIRAERQRGKEKLAEQRRELNAEKRKAVSETKEIERATAAAHREADTVMMKAKAAERLRRNDERWKQKADENRNRWNLKRKAAAKALSDSKKVTEKRNAHETEQGMVNTIRKVPGDKKYVEQLQESAANLRTLGRAAYRNFVSRAADIEAFGRRQVSGIRADTLVNIVGATPTTIEHIFKSGLVDRNGNRIGGSMKEVFLVMDKRGRVDEERQALLQDYMLHLHNTDRMGIEDKALDQLRAYEVENPWLLEMDPKEFALLVGMTETEVKKTGKQEAQKRAIEYAKLLDNYNTAENKPIFPDEDGNPVTAKTSRGIVEKYLQENPWLEEKANGIYEWWDLFMKTWAIGDSLTQSQYDAMREMYPHYVPTYRVQDKTGAAVSVAVTGARPGQAVKRATGGLSQVMNIEDGFSQLVSKIVKLNRVNEFYKNIVDTAMLDESGDFWDMAVFDWDSVAKKDVPLLRPDFADQAEDADAVGLEKTEHGDYRLSAWYDGKLYSCFLSEDMFKAISDIAGKTNSDLERILLKAGNALTGAMKTAITGINPTFALRNISRDIPTAIVNSISGFAFPKYWAKALNEMRKNSDRWQQFQALGGTHAEYYNQEQGFANAMAERRGAGAKVVGALGWFNEVTEAQTRFAEYLATIERLGDTYENRLLGIKNSAEVTVDFSRKGKYGKVINAWVPYWNPAVQGIDKTIRSVIESKDGSAIWRKAVVTVGRAAVINVLAEAVLYAVLKALGRYDDWEELDDRTKDTYYCIPLPTEHKFLKIPRNREWGAILGAPIQRILEYANGRENPFENYVQTALQPNFMAGNIVPVWDGEKWSSDMIIVSQALDLAQNKNFYGSSIVPYAYQQGSVTEQYDSETSILGRALGELLNFSPMQIDYLISDYFGDFGDLFINATSEATWAGDNTVVDLAQSVLDMVTDPFLTNSQYSNRSVSKYYDTLDELEKVVQDKKNQMGSDAYKNTVEYQTQTALNKLYGNTISELNKEVRNLPDGEEKDALKEQIATIAAAALEYYDQCMSGEIANPVLDATYSTVSDHISDELIRLDAFADDYAFEPTYSPSKTYTDPRRKTREYNLDEEQRDYLKKLFLVEYDKQVTELLNSSKYKNLSDEKKAEKIAEVRSDAIEAAKEQFFDWLEETGVRSTKKD